jgi:hypothetical protein
MPDSPPALPRPAGHPAAHLAAAVVAAAAIVLLPMGWPWEGAAPGLAAWWPAMLAVMASAVAYAIITTMLHAHLLRHPDWRPSIVEPLVDLAILLESAALLARGAESRVLLAGLSFVPPVLAVLSAVSLVVVLIARRREAPAPIAPPPPLTVAFSWRLLAAIALIAAVAWLEAHGLPTQ